MCTCSTCRGMISHFCSLAVGKYVQCPFPSVIISRHWVVSSSGQRSAAHTTATFGSHFTLFLSCLSGGHSAKHSSLQYTATVVTYTEVLSTRT